MQDEVRKGHPHSIPGKVVSIRQNGCSVYVWCPGKAKRLLRNHRKMRLRLQINDDDDDEGGDGTDKDEAEMTDEEEIDVVDDESHKLLTVLAGVPTVTGVTVHQVTTDGKQLSSALRTMQTGPRPVQLSQGGERVRLVQFSLECFHKSDLQAGDQLCPGLLTSTGQDYLCCCEEGNSLHRLCGGKFYKEYK